MNDYLMFYYEWVQLDPFTFIVNILFYTGLSFLFTESEPMILLKRRLGFKEEDYDSFSKYKKYLHKLLYCTWCSSLWIGFFISFSLKMAVITSLFVYIIEKQRR